MEPTVVSGNANAGVADGWNRPKFCAVRLPWTGHERAG